MCLRSKSITYSFYAIMLVAAFIFPSVVPAQHRTTVKKAKSQKAIRVFYGQASYYDNKFNGKRTASGEIFSQKKFTCACNVLPLGTWVRVTNLQNGKSVIVKTNDRIHPNMKRIVDLTRTGAQQLGYVSRGLTRVKVEVIDKKFMP